MINLKYKFAVGLFIILFSFWLLLSGKLDAFHIIFGLASTALVTIMCYDMVFENEAGNRNPTKIFRFLVYVPWLIYQIIIANIDVAKRVLHPSMPIEPDFIVFKSRLKSEMSRTTLANSITLTPGTITVDIVGDEFIVHAIARAPADDLLKGAMEKKVAHVFMEDE